MRRILFAWKNPSPFFRREKRFMFMPHQSPFVFKQESNLNNPITKEIPFMHATSSAIPAKQNKLKVD